MDLTGRGCGFIEDQVRAGKPFFLQLSHYAVHLSVFYREETLRKVSGTAPGKKHSLPPFAAMTGDLDHGIGVLMAKLRELGILDNTYIFYLSDNGGRGKMPIEGVNSVRAEGQAPSKVRPALTGVAELPRNHPLSGCKHTLYEGGIRVPFCVTGPGIEPGSVARTPVTGLDILPTIADLAGYDKPLPENIDGGSIKDVILGRGREVRRARPFLVFHDEKGGPRSKGGKGGFGFESALIMGNFKLMKFWGTDSKRDVVELYDLSRDLGEEHDLSATNPEMTRKLESLLDQYMKDVDGKVRGSTGKKTRKKKGGV